MKLTGTLERVEFGAGAWVLRTQEGRTVQLVGHIPADLAGSSVKVSGQVVEGGVGFAMVGDIVNVRNIDRA